MFGLFGLLSLFGLLGLSVLLGLLLAALNVETSTPRTSGAWVLIDLSLRGGGHTACPRAECEAAWPDMIRDTASRQPVRVSSVRALRLRQTWPLDAPLDLDPERVMTIGVCA